MSRLNHSSSPSDVANSTQPKFVMEGLVMWLKAGVGYFKCSHKMEARPDMSCTCPCAIRFVPPMGGSLLLLGQVRKIWTPMEVKGSGLLK